MLYKGVIFYAAPCILYKQLGSLLFLCLLAIQRWASCTSCTDVLCRSNLRTLLSSWDQGKGWAGRPSVNISAIAACLTQKCWSKWLTMHFILHYVIYYTDHLFAVNHRSDSTPEVDLGGAGVIPSNDLSVVVCTGPLKTVSSSGDGYAMLSTLSSTWPHLNSDVGLEEGEYWQNCLCAIVLCNISAMHFAQS